MFIELAEFLRCPDDPSEALCVVVPDEMIGRTVWRGVVGCPATRLEYPIRDGVADFGGNRHRPAVEGAAWPPVDAAALHALLGLEGAGGYVVVLGSVARIAHELARHVGGVHVVAVNAPDDVEPSPALSVLRGPHPLPLRTAMARGVVVGAEFATEPWLSDAARLVLPGRRLVVLREAMDVVGMMPLASGSGVWVGEKTRDGAPLRRQDSGGGSSR